MKEVKELQEIKVDNIKQQLLSFEWSYDEGDKEYDKENDIWIAVKSGPNSVITDVELKKHEGKDISKEIANYLYEHVDYIKINTKPFVNTNVYKDANIKQRLGTLMYLAATINRYGKPNTCICNTNTSNTYKVNLPEGLNIVINENIKDNDIFFSVNLEQETTPGLKYLSYTDPETNDYYYKIIKCGFSKYMQYKVTIK